MVPTAPLNAKTDPTGGIGAVGAGVPTSVTVSTTRAVPTIPGSSRVARSVRSRSSTRSGICPRSIRLRTRTEPPFSPVLPSTTVSRTHIADSSPRKKWLLRTVFAPSATTKGSPRRSSKPRSPTVALNRQFDIVPPASYATMPAVSTISSQAPGPIRSSRSIWSPPSSSAVVATNATFAPVASWLITREARLPAAQPQFRPAGTDFNANEGHGWVCS